MAGGQQHHGDLANITEEGGGSSSNQAARPPTNNNRGAQSNSSSPTPQQQQQAGSSARTRRGFAGNAAFQSAIQRKGGEPQPPSSPMGAFGANAQGNRGAQPQQHARRISLQSRTGNLAGRSQDQEDALSNADDGASIASYNTDSPFDPTRKAMHSFTPQAQQQQQQRASHFRSGSEFPNMVGRQQAYGGNAHGRTASMGQAQLGMPFAGGFVSPQQALLQQQIEVSRELVRSAVIS